MKSRLLLSLVFLLLFSTYKIQNNFNLSNYFSIDEILIENNKILNSTEIKNEFSFLYEKNLFFLKNKNIKKKLKQNSFVDSFEIKKIYPNKIIIKIFEKKPVAILQNKRKKYYFTDKGEVIKFLELKKYNDLPIVFGDKVSFSIFYENLKKMNFPTNKIKSFYFFESNRWDLVTTKNQTVKLPSNNYLESLNNFLRLEIDQNFEKYKIFDYRINNQLILK
tara:strand:+ start:613 stop:1272 length:660 start_codon:yes stop_codon:yes gene_type:complete